MIFFNWQGLAGTASAAIIWAVLQDRFPNAKWPLFVAGGLALAFDALMRSSNDEPRRWFSLKAGGHLSFIPTWAYGVAMIGAGLFWKPDPRIERYRAERAAAHANVAIEQAFQRIASEAMAAEKFTGKAAFFYSENGERCFLQFDFDTPPDVAPSRRFIVAKAVEARFQRYCGQHWFLFMEKHQPSYASLDGSQLPAAVKSILPYFAQPR